VETGKNILKLKQSQIPISRFISRVLANLLKLYGQTSVIFLVVDVLDNLGVLCHVFHAIIFVIDPCVLVIIDKKLGQVSHFTTAHLQSRIINRVVTYYPIKLVSPVLQALWPHQ